MRSQIACAKCGAKWDTDQMRDVVVTGQAQDIEKDAVEDQILTVCVRCKKLVIDFINTPTEPRK